MTEKSRYITVLRAGSLTLVEDGGRPGLGHLAIPPSGVLDRKAWRLANRLVGNDENAAVLETTLTGAEIRVSCRCYIAVTGAQALVAVDGNPASLCSQIMLNSGQTINIGPATAGIRSYLAISGGIEVPSTFGSKSTDLLSGLGPPPLADGEVIPLGPILRSPPIIDFAPYTVPEDTLCLTIYLGPRDGWLSQESIFQLSRQVWTVQTTSNRIGLRLDGPSLTRNRNDELFSEGIVTGAIQIPPDGQPIIFLADHPTTGGYPVVGVISDRDLDLCAQARPGTQVSFHIRLPTKPFSHL